MSCSMTRVGSLLLTALLLTLGISRAGELSRPVPPDAQVTNFTRFNIRYSLRDVIAQGVQKVEFYITEDMGRTWRLYGEDPDRISPMTIEVPGEGVYGFVCIATDINGNREREPVARTRPETVIVVDKTPPAVKWLSPTQDILGRGQGVELKWEASDPYFGVGPVKIEYAVNARGPEAIWNTVQDKLSATGTINWTPPTGGSAKYSFRLIARDRAGNTTVSFNPVTVTVDGTPPMISGVSPLRSNKLENDITVNADDGVDGSGVKEMSLYTSGNGGGTWTLVKETIGGESVPVQRKPGEAIAFTASRSGEYALWPVIFDEAGNATSLPSVGVPGPYILVIDTEKPQVSLSDSFLMGRAAVLANETRRIEWTAYDPHLQAYSAIIHLSLDNGSTWQELRAGLPASGSEIVNFPFGSQSEDAKIKVTVADEFGNVGEDVSIAFKLSNAATSVVGVEPSQTSSFPTTPSTPSTSTSWPQESGTAPYIPLPADSSQPTVTSPDYPPIQQPPSTGIPPSSPSTGWPQSTDWGTPPAPTTPTTPQYRDPVSDFNAINGESSASSIPSAMLDRPRSTTGTGGQQLELALPPASDAPPSTASSSGGWTPSPPRASESSVSPFPAPDASSTWSTPPALDSAQTSAPASQGDVFGAPIDLGGSPVPQPPPGPATSPSLPASSESASGPSGFDGIDFGGSIQPPSLLPPGDQASLPGGNTTGLSLPEQTGGAPSLGGQPSSMPSLDSALRPNDPFSPPPPVAQSMPPAQTSPASPAPGMQQTADLGPPVPSTLEPSPIGDMAPRPSNTRDLSNHYVTESKAYQEEGRLDKALESATTAINTDDKNPAAFMQLSQLNARSVPPDYVRAATLAKAATDLAGSNWETWWNCAEVYYIWAHARNREIQAMNRTGQPAPADLLGERNSTLSNARIAIGNAAVGAQNQNASADARKKIANTQGLIAYLDAMTITEPVNTGEASGPAADQYRSAMQSYKSAAAPKLLDALPYFRQAAELGTQPTYSELFHLGMINYRLGNMERDTGNMAQATTYYTEAAEYLLNATTSRDVPNEGPREAYYMLAHCYDQLSRQPGADGSRQKERALNYWRATVEFYPPGSPYRTFAEQRIEALSLDMGL